MKKLAIRLDKGETEVWLRESDSVTGSPRALLSCGYPRSRYMGVWIGAYLTKRAAERIRDWLTEWLEKQECE